jgi:hypothetical protein
MTLRGPLRWLYVIGAIGWPVGGWGFSGFHTMAGALIIGIGSWLVLTCCTVEIALRLRDRRRHDDGSPAA